MEFIRNVSAQEVNAGTYRSEAGFVPKSKLTQLHYILPDRTTFHASLEQKPTLHVGLVESTEGVGTIAVNSLLEDFHYDYAEVRRWEIMHTFLLEVLAVNQQFSLWTADRKPMATADLVDALMRYKVYVCVEGVNNSIGAVRYSSGEYHVWSPFILNGGYNSGHQHYRKKSTKQKVALTTVRRYVRPVLAEHKHLPEIPSVLRDREDVVDTRRQVSKQHLQYVHSRAQVRAAEELVSLRKHQLAGRVDPYQFIDVELLSKIDEYIEEEAVMGDAIDEVLEGSKCYQRVQLHPQPISGNIFYQSTYIEVGSSVYDKHKVYGDNAGTFQPIEDIPDSVASQISTLDFLGKDMSTMSYEDNAWVLNTGVMVKKGVLYYLPVPKIDSSLAQI
tara:strand:+ start:247 stop:1410 length:1164 start_codon:yes stop_codon:yes gene_type:complete